MKIIEAMKQIKELLIKAEDLKSKVKLHHAHLSYENPVYGTNQKAHIDEWIQGHSDVLQEVARLKEAIQRTNLATKVTIQLGGVQVTKTITEWIYRRRELAALEQSLWSALNDKGLQESRVKTSGGDIMEVKIVRYYDPATRDAKIELFRSEPSKIDSTLEIINAVTDLI